MNLNKIFNLLKTEQPVSVKIEDPLCIKKEYKYWRFRIFYSIYIGNVFYCLVRKNLIFMVPFLVSYSVITQNKIGCLVSISSITYGISKLLSGILSDRSNPRYFMSIGLVLTGITSILFSYCSSFSFFCILCALNGWFLGWGWPACTKELTHWFTRSERGTWWSICSTSSIVGISLAGLLTSWSGQHYGWRIAMLLPGILCIVIGFWLMNRLRDIPESLGLPPIESFGDTKEPIETILTESSSIRTILLKYLLNNHYIWLLAGTSFLVHIIRESVGWYYVYLIEIKNYSYISAATCIALSEMGGFFGTLIVGRLSDYWFNGNRIPLIILCSFGLMLSFIGIWYLSFAHAVLFFVFVTLVGFFIAASNMLIGLNAAEFVTKKIASASNGFISFVGYFGAAVGGYPLIKVVELYGWDIFTLVLAVCSGSIVIILSPVWHK